MTDPVRTTPGALMRSEILEQPQRWREILDTRTAIDAAARLIRETNPALLIIAARGSSDHAGMYAQYLAHNLLGIPAQLATPSTGTVFGSVLRYPAAVMIAISQSGSSPDLLHTVDIKRRAGVPVIALTNDPASPVAQAADVHVPLKAGPELSVAATKTYTAELLTLFLLISRAAEDSWSALGDRALTTALAAEKALPTVPDLVQEAVDALESADRALVVGRGYAMATAKEGALKLTETSSIAASGWSAADATHGPLGQIRPETPVILLTADEAGRESVDRFGQQAAALGGHLITFPPLHDATDPSQQALIPLLEILPLQVTALRLALTRGLDPDRPAGLSKVTRTL